MPFVQLRLIILANMEQPKTLAEQLLLAQAEGKVIKVKRPSKKNRIPEHLWVKNQPITLTDGRVIMVPIDKEGNRNKNMIPISMMSEVVMKIISRIYEAVVDEGKLPDARELDTLSKVLERMQKLSYMAYGDGEGGQSDKGPLKGGDTVAPLFQQVYKIEQAVKLGDASLNTESLMKAVESMDVEARKIKDRLNLPKEDKKPSVNVMDVEVKAMAAE